MKKHLFRGLAAVIISAAMCVPVSAAEMTTGRQSLTARQANSYLYTIMDHLLNNYVGKDLTVEELYAAAAKGMTQPLDNFTEYLSAEEYEAMYNSLSGNFTGIGIQFTVRLDGALEVINVIADSPAKKAGVLKGDIIRKVNSTSVDGYSSDSLAKLIADASEQLTIEVLRGTETKRFTMRKAEVHMSTVEYDVLDSGIGYIYISQIGEYTAREMRTAVKELQSRDVTQVILDLRGNPGGYKDVIEEISRMFVPKGVIYSTIDAAGKKVVYSSSLEKTPFKDVTILVDGGTASASELFTSAMQDAKAAVVIGSRTYGKGIIQSFAELPMGDMLKYTSMEYLRRNGGKLHGIGITPDIVITKPDALSDEMYLMNNDGTGIGVKNCKALLKYIGYEVGASDNRYDDKTKEAVMDVQKKAGLNPTGMFDMQTIIAINNAYGIYLRDNDVELERAVKVLTGRAAA